MTYFRIQNEPAELLLDGPQSSTYWSDYADDVITVPGKAVCASRQALAEYVSHSGHPYSSDWVLVELEGTLVAHDDDHAHLGVLIVQPTRIVNVEPLSALFSNQP